MPTHSGGAGAAIAGGLLAALPIADLVWLGNPATWPHLITALFGTALLIAGGMECAASYRTKS